MSTEQPDPSWLQHVQQLVSARKLDLSSDEDLSLAVMNLISLEEHLFFSGAKTGKQDYYHLIQPIRELRKTYLKQLLPDYEGEVWCTCKHLLAAAMRLIEVGTKRQERDPQAAAVCFQHAWVLYGHFWALKLKMAQRTTTDSQGAVKPPTNQQAIEEFLAKLVDCCGE